MYYYKKWQHYYSVMWNKTKITEIYCNQLFSFCMNKINGWFDESFL